MLVLLEPIDRVLSFYKRACVAKSKTMRNSEKLQSFSGPNLMKPKTAALLDFFTLPTRNIVFYQKLEKLTMYSSILFSHKSHVIGHKSKLRVTIEKFPNTQQHFSPDLGNELKTQSSDDTFETHQDSLN